MHYLTFVPLIAISVLQDAHLVLAAILGTSVSAIVLLAGWALHSSGYIKVWQHPVLAAPDFKQCSGGTA